MARQEQIFAMTIVAMKKATARRDDGSDSDDSIRRPTNRGNKLKRKARYAEPGRLDTTDGRRKRRILYNGYSRTILNNNPARVDADGDIIDEVEGEESDADLTPAEDDPFGEVRLHELLMPLTNAAGLKQHPSLSVPYTSGAIEQMILNVQNTLHREQEALWRLKQQTSELRGDQTWMPCGAFETDNDILTLAQFPSSISQPPSAVLSIPSSVGITEAGHIRTSSETANWDTMSNVRLVGDIEEASTDDTATETQHDAYQAPEFANQEATGMKTATGVSDFEQPSTSITTDQSIGNSTVQLVTNREARPAAVDNQDIYEIQKNDGQTTIAAAVIADPTVNTESLQGSQVIISDSTNKPPTDDLDTKMEDAGVDVADEIDDASQPIHRMTTRTQARAAEAPSSPSSRSIPSSPPLSPIHPFFLVPLSVRADSSIGLPPEQADEIRRLLIAYVQRQEDVCRGVSQIYTGLLRAKKMKDNVLEWCNAEGHIGEMSDGEDWVDLEQWGLEPGDLRKGEEVEEEEEQGRGGKKTRNRRQVA